MAQKAGAKRKKAEKAKTQLKAQNKIAKKDRKKNFRLPKGLNIVDTTLNSKKIVMPIQLKDPAASIGLPLTTRRRLGLNDCFVKLGHYSLNHKLEGIEGIMDLLTGNPGLVEEHLSSLIKKLAPMSSDLEPEIRSASTKVLAEILSKVDVAHLEPLYSSICAHLCCALSHIDPDIQTDSLELLDTLIQHVPDFVASKYDQLLLNCVEQISKGKGREENRTLSMGNVDRKLTILGWRGRVLKRVKKILEIVLLNVSGESVVDCSRLPLKIEFDESNPWIISSEYGIRRMKFQSSSPILVSDLDVKSYKKNSFQFDKFIKNLTPLLLEAWDEATSSYSSDGLIEALNIMEIIVKSITIILQLLTEDKARKINEKPQIWDEFSSKISSGLLNGFPFTSLHHGEVCDSINLAVSAIYTQTCPSPDPAVMEKIIKVICSTADDGSSSSGELMASSLPFLRRIYSEGNYDRDLNDLLTRSLDSYPNSEILIEFLSELALSSKAPIPIVESWIKKLPETLISAESSVMVTKVHLRTIDQLQKRNNPALMESFRLHLKEISDKIEGIRFRNEYIRDSVYRILSIIRYRLGENDDKMLCKFITKNISVLA